jgi:hypothetical protein
MSAELAIYLDVDRYCFDPEPCWPDAVRARTDHHGMCGAIRVVCSRRFSSENWSRRSDVNRGPADYESAWTRNPR